jgi:hypothetical protein
MIFIYLFKLIEYIDIWYNINSKSLKTKIINLRFLQKNDKFTNKLTTFNSRKQHVTYAHKLGKVASYNASFHLYRDVSSCIWFILNNEMHSVDSLKKKIHIPTNMTIFKSFKFITLTTLKLLVEYVPNNVNVCECLLRRIQQMIWQVYLRLISLLITRIHAN